MGTRADKGNELAREPRQSIRQLSSLDTEDTVQRQLVVLNLLCTLPYIHVRVKAVIDSRVLSTSILDSLPTVFIHPLHFKYLGYIRTKGHEHV